MRRFYFALAPLLATALASASSSWDKCYEAGLSSVKTGQWGSARVQFELAAHARRGDSSRAIYLEGSLFDEQKWRDGAPYSPNFLAAYCGLKCASTLSDADKAAMLKQVESEFENIINHGQYSREAFFFLDETYMLAGDMDKRPALSQKFEEFGSKANWRVDSEGIDSADEAMVAQMATPEIARIQERKHDRRGRRAKPSEKPKGDIPAEPTTVSPAPMAPPQVPSSTEHENKHKRRHGRDKDSSAKAAVQTVSLPGAGQASVKTIPLAPATEPVILSSRKRDEHKGPKLVHPARTQDPVLLLNPNVPLVGAVAPSAQKYALIVGNSESKFDGDKLPFAGDDAQVVRQALISNAGYLDQNVQVVVNTTAQELAATVNALASRIHDRDTVFIYYTGVGLNIEGKDYFAGVDCDVNTDAGSMLSKDDVFHAFMAKGARIFAFYQVNRHIENGHFFGSELPLVGSVSQMEGTLPGQMVYSVSKDGKAIGLFTNALVAVLTDLRSNSVPINDFGWQVFYKMRRGDTGQFGGSSNQSPSLPVLTNMATDARF